MTSEILINLTKIGLGRELPGEYFPNLKQSLTEFGPIELLMLESTLAALLRSSSKRADLDKPEGHSPTPYKTTLNFLSELGNTLDKDFSPVICLDCRGVFSATCLGSHSWKKGSEADRNQHLLRHYN